MQKQTISLLLLTSALAFASSGAAAAPGSQSPGTPPGSDYDATPQTSSPAVQNPNGQSTTDRDKGQNRAQDRMGKEGYPTDTTQGKTKGSDKNSKGHRKGNTKAPTESY